MNRYSDCNRVWMLLAALLAVPAAWALEMGAPLFDEDIDDRVTVEVLYERLERDIRQEMAFSEDRFSAQQEEDRTRAQVAFYPLPALSVRFDAGVASADEAESPVPLVGALLKYRLLTWRGARLALAAGGTYVEAIEYHRSGALTPIAEIAAVERIESYYEVGGGLQLSRPLNLSSVWTLHPYVAVAASWLRADGTEQFTLETSGRGRTDHSVDFREDSPITLAVGLAALANHNFGARVETRFVDDASYSAGIFFSF